MALARSADGNFVPAPAAAGIQDLAAALALHALSEAVGAVLALLAGLIGAFHRGLALYWF